MMYQFAIQGRISQEILRVVSEQLAFATGCLQEMEDRHLGIHEARKSLKKVRAALRLAQTALPPETFYYANRLVRDQGRAISALRDASALIEALDKLRLLHPEWIDEENYRQIRQVLEMRRDALFQQMIGREQIDRQVIVELETFGQGVKHWKPTQRSFQKAFQPGLETTYANGIAAFRLAIEQPTAHHFHEWRKRVKDLWYHVLLLEACWPPVMMGFGEALHLLSDVLGDEHDLNVFHEQLVQGEIATHTEESRQGLLHLFEQEIEVLRVSAIEMGHKVYNIDPHLFGDQFAGCWRQARRRRVAT